MKHSQRQIATLGISESPRFALARCLDFRASPVCIASGLLSGDL